MKNMELKIKLTTYWAISIIPIAINSALLSYFNTISALIISMLIFTSYMLTIKIISRKVSDINTDNLWQAGFLYIASAILLSIVFVISLTNSNAIPGTESFIDIFYFCIVTLTTLGYGDMTPKGDYAKIIACAMSLIGTTNMIILIAVVSAKLKSENSANF
jgi:hypothetical protein